jgi:hypothetical protein
MMNITTIKNSGITTLTIKKESHAFRPNAKEFPDHSYLANQIKNPSHVDWGCSLPSASDPARILPVGTTLKILSINKTNTRYSCAFITVLSSTGLTFDILSTDINRFCQ